MEIVPAHSPNTPIVHLNNQDVLNDRKHELEYYYCDKLEIVLVDWQFDIYLK